MLGDINTDDAARKYSVSKVDNQSTYRVDSNSTAVNPPVLEISNTTKKGITRTLVKLTDNVSVDGINQSYSTHLVITRGNIPTKVEVTEQIERMQDILNLVDFKVQLLNGVLI